MKTLITPIMTAIFLAIVSSCSIIDPYRDIEIAIYNTDHAQIRLTQLPDSTTAYRSYIDTSYEPVLHIPSLKNGVYYLQIWTTRGWEINKMIDTTFVYKGRFSFAAEF